MAKQMKDGIRSARKRVDRLRLVHGQMVAVAERAQTCADEIRDMLRAAESELRAAELGQVAVVVERAEASLAEAAVQIPSARPGTPVTPAP